MSAPCLSQKAAGAYYTPDPVVTSLLRWAVREASDRMLDPSCGDGRFIAGHRNSVGIEQDAVAAATAVERAPWALVHEGDFFTWAAETRERFECTAGNPPFIRYQTFKGPVRERAQALCRSLGAEFSGLSSSWAPFLVAAASLLKPGGRMAFVVPAEIGHAPYAGPLLEYLVEQFKTVQLVAVRSKLFPTLSEDCWLLYADGFGGRTSELRFTVLDAFKPVDQPPHQGITVPVSEWRTLWKRRLRPYLLTDEARELYRLAAGQTGSRRLGEIAQVGIGYVSGANDFFHLRPTEAERWDIPCELLHPAVRNGRALPEKQLTAATIAEWKKQDDAILLLRLPKTGSLPGSVKRYLATAEAREAREAYKCRVRKPWYSVPDVQVPDFFMSYMSGHSASLVHNAAGATCTNSVHSVRVRDKAAVGRLVKSWDSDLVRLSRELEGHPLGGGMLKLEPREAAQIVIPPSALMPKFSASVLGEAVATMKRWRHYADHR